MNAELFNFSYESIDFTKFSVGLFLYPSVMFLPALFFISCTPDEPGGGDKPSEEKRKEQTTPVVSPSQGSPEAKEERYQGRQ